MHVCYVLVNMSVHNKTTLKCVRRGEVLSRVTQVTYNLPIHNESMSRQCRFVSFDVQGIVYLGRTPITRRDSDVCLGAVICVNKTTPHLIPHTQTVMYVCLLDTLYPMG
jgi:hypothetical protein